MYRLHRALQDLGVESKLLALRPTPSSDVAELPRLPRVERFLGAFTTRLGLNDIHRVGSFLLPQHEDFRFADVVHFHCLHTRTLSYLALPRLTADRPSVLTLHDMWAVTGHCAYSQGCDRWKEGCGDCPHPETHPPVRRDATRLEWRLKRRAFDRSRITLVAKSAWMEEQLSESFLKD